jgi:uncharacterized protein YkwD
MRITGSILPVFLCAVTACTLQAPAASSVSAPRPQRARTDQPAPPIRSAYGATEARIFDLVNAQRRRRGLQPLVYNDQLDRMAKVQAGNMARYEKMAHVLPQSDLPTLADRARYAGYEYGRLAENVALGYPSAEAVVQGWMNSEGHRENILNHEVVETGIGVMRSRDGGLYYCQVFGRQR